MQNTLSTIGKNFQTVLIVDFTKKKSKRLSSLLELNGLKFDAMYIAKRTLVSYDLMLKDFDLNTEAAKNRIIVKP